MNSILKVDGHIFCYKVRKLSKMAVVAVLAVATHSCCTGLPGLQ